GYVGGAFTGARSSGLAGKFELANGGTLFLDEIGEMPIDMQPKLLRAIQEREIYRIGGQKPINIDVRIICATNRNLDEFVSQGKFRADLYHRIKVGYIQLKPLNQQKEAIIPLAKMFLEEYSLKRGKQFQKISPAAVDLLLNYEWKGNVRELANAIDRAVLHHNDTELTARHLSFLDENYNPDSSFVLTPTADFQLPEQGLNLEELEREIVRRTLKKFRGNKTKTAEFLGLTRSALRSRM
ncbi:MAG TPA: sigma 54-interacting transcriptional regulator, partial [Candidatus Kapabacteria bacterium]|nr:sigma 54-interacting transcriptional regulator [Candidatus Kapabacteria bacterium]